MLPRLLRVLDVGPAVKELCVAHIQMDGDLVSLAQLDLIDQLAQDRALLRYRCQFELVRPAKELAVSRFTLSPP